MRPVTIETLSQSFASAHSLAPSETRIALSARLSQLQPEGRSVGCCDASLYSREYIEDKKVPQTGGWRRTSDS